MPVSPRTLRAVKTASLTALEANAARIARILKTLANEERLRILSRLAGNKLELSHAELAAGIPISQSALSQHLTKLRNRGFVCARRDGHNTYYRIADPRALRLMNAMRDALKGTTETAVQVPARVPHDDSHADEQPLPSVSQRLPA